MEVIVKGRVKPPKFEYHGKPDFVDLVEADAWWKEQHNLWLHGYTGDQGFLHGVHYFWMTQIRWKDAEGDIMKAKWRDVDDIMAGDFIHCDDSMTDYYLFKRREVGGSTFFGIVVPYWRTMVRKPGSNVGMTSNTQNKTNRLFKDKFSKSYAFIDERIRPEKTQDQATGLMSFKIRGHDGNLLDNESSILAKQTTENLEAASAFESERMSYFFCDEMFLHEFAGPLRRSVEPCLKKSGIKIGPFVAIGSSGTVSTEGRKEAMSILKNQSNMAARVTFIPGWMHMDQVGIRDEHGEVYEIWNLAPNGWSDEELSIEYVKQERERLDKNEDKRDLISYTVQYPLEIREMFELVEGTMLPEEVEKIVINRLKALKDNPAPPFVRYKIGKDAAGKPEIKADHNGPLYLQELPRKGEKYKFGIDPINAVNDINKVSTAEAMQGKRSLFAVSIKRLSTKKYIGYYLIRTDNPHVQFMDTSLLHEMFNEAPCSLEINAGATFILECERAEKLRMIENQPMYLYPDTYDKNSLKGYHKDRYNASRIQESLWSYLRSYIHLIDSEYILECLTKYGKENVDIVDAMMACEVSEMNDLLMEEKKKKRAGAQQAMTTITTWQMVGGVMQQVKVQVPVDEVPKESEEEIGRRIANELIMNRDPRTWTTRA